jgi:phosphate/sulfate permease
MLAFRHPAAVALAGAVRLTPALLAPSVGFLATARFGVLIVLVSLLGAGIENHIDWLRTVPASAPTASSVSGITGLPPIVVLVGCALVALLGWRPAVVAVTLASPVTYFYTLGFLTLLLVPFGEGSASRWRTAASLGLGRAMDRRRRRQS